MTKLLAAFIFCVSFGVFLNAQKNATYTPIFLGNVSTTLAESSALVFYDSALWSINDGGNAAILYKIDTAPPYRILQTFVLKDAVNIDWEALTQSETHFYIGDFGNNMGDRKDLKILKFAKTELLKQSSYPKNDTIQNIETIEFEYSDQIYHKFAPHNNNFDCEAFIHYGDSLYLFSKNWIDSKTKVYQLPTTAGRYKAILKQTHDIGFTVTDISIDKNHNNLILIGYHGRYGSCFAYTVKGFTDTDFFSGETKRWNLPHLLYTSQIEGVAFANGHSGWIIGEKFTRRGIKVLGMLHWFDFSDYFDNASNDINTYTAFPRQKNESFKKKLPSYPYPIDKTFEINLKNLKKGLWYIEYFSPKGEFLHAQTITAKDDKLTIDFPENLNSGEYIVRASTMRENIIYKIKKL